MTEYYYYYFHTDKFILNWKLKFKKNDWLIINNFSNEEDKIKGIEKCVRLFVMLMFYIVVNIIK